MRIYSTYLVALASLAAAGCKAPAPPLSEGARKTVDNFYAWYAPMQRDSPMAAMRAIRERQAFFGMDVVAALRADSAASAQSPGEVAGLDGDPFLNSQDPCEHYATSGVAQVGNRFLVQVLGSGKCEVHTNADVTVEVTPVDGRFVFTNFVYSARDRDDLLETLADLAAARRTGKRKAP